MTPALARAQAWGVDQLRRLRELARRHPVRAILALPTLFLLYVLVLIPFTPSISDLRKAKSEVPTVVMSSDGVVLAEFKRINRQWVPLNKVSKSVVDALIATEDRRFYEHHGIDLRRTAGAALNTLRGVRQGGSTITQQLARNLYPQEIGRAASLTRKTKEAITALKIEAIYSKQEILETYLNTVPFLYNAFGIEMAARTYFDKSADKLDVLESATLIGMLKGTSYYNPVLNPERARERRNTVLAQMVKYGKLDAKRAEVLAARPLRVDFERQNEPIGIAPHVAQQVRKWLIAWADREDYDIYADGLVVRTTIDTRLQKAANQAVARQLAQLQGIADRSRRKGEERALVQAGFLAIDPRSARVLAWVGSSDFAVDQFDHVNQARRQPGSTFKPFVYGAAFGQGLAPEDVFIDEPVAIRDRGGAVWSPRDTTPPTNQPMTLRDGLVHSRNSITAQVMQRVGPPKVIELAQALGVRESKLEPVMSLALGTSPVTLREMVTAYGTLANNGRYLGEPQLIARVEDRKGRTLALFTRPKGEEAMPKPLALQLVNVMRGVVDEGTGTAIRTRYGIQADVAGKTGTTQDNTDGWFILMHPQVVAGAWVGFNDPRITMGDSWGPGARSALPMVGDFFNQALRTRTVDARAEFDIPRPRPKPREPARSDPVQEIVNDLLGRLMRMIQ
ncbi:penicillin-binding protein 1A [Ramlibacter alkalitolerans]|uniref:Transglycosylase domain-containing protein n=1 Tax=Ramlibacter alkalitolerans TaxID=2039631 RepID=A0ABS1JW20_9BURK|nr:transglycosylase domain-containing protein [Ramlibacter alkalitolerans]MBL0428414.1 transglycosylase domain-containing protein [Ramlibacter alkalitolerans]